MKISSKDWQNYIATLRKINETAAEKVAEYMRSHDCSTPEGMKALIDYAHAVATKYGEGAAELSCEMLDEVAEASGAFVPAAEPAATATYEEIAKTIYGTMAATKDPDAVGAAVGRSVKLASVDTLQQNALRDGAEWAWIPAGDTCPFCLMLASRGWVRASKKAIKNGHADHIHNNCDCTYCVRYDGETTVEGYDPDALYEQYENAGDTPRERLNALRRQHYAANKDYINAQKRAAYAKRSSRKMASTVQLPNDFGVPHPGNIIEKDRLIEIIDKFEKTGIKISTGTHGEYGGFDTYKGNPKVLENLAETLADNKTIWGVHNQNIPIRIAYEPLGNFDDLAVARNGVIILNKDIFDDTDYMKRYYQYLASHGTRDKLSWFVPGTDYRSVIMHEVGHRVMARNKLAYSKIRDIIVNRYGSVEAFCLNHLSEYGMILTEGRYLELISELSSATLSTDASRRKIAREILMEVFGS